MTIRRSVFLAGAACLLAITGTALAQEDDEGGSIYTISTYQWPFANLDEIFELMEETADLTEQNEYIISQKVLQHNWGGAFSVMVVSEYASMEDIAKAQERNNELFEEKYPDEAERDALNDKLNALMGDGIHEDNIASEVTSLTK